MSILESTAMAVKSPQQLKDEIEGKTTPEAKTADDSDPKLNKDCEFEFSHTDKRGRVWKGRFKNRILNFTDHSRVGALKARLSGGLPIESLDAFTIDHNEKMAHLTVSLIQRPTWAADFGELFDKEILERLYEEVASHEAKFHGRGQDQEMGEEGSSNGSGAA
jgi:hypothetical protein